MLCSGRIARRTTSGRWEVTTATLRAINEQGQVVGTSKTAGDEWHAFLWENGGRWDLGTLGGNRSEAVAMTGQGQMMGQEQDQDR